MEESAALILEKQRLQRLIQKRDEAVSQQAVSQQAADL